MKTLTEKATHYRNVASQHAADAAAYAKLFGWDDERRQSIALAVRYMARAENCERAELAEVL